MQSVIQCKTLTKNQHFRTIIFKIPGKTLPNSAAFMEQNLYRIVYVTIHATIHLLDQIWSYNGITSVLWFVVCYAFCNLLSFSALLLFNILSSLFVINVCIQFKKKIVT